MALLSGNRISSIAPKTSAICNAFMVTFALDSPLQIGWNVNVKRFLLRHETVTNPAVYRIDIHAHHPWLVVMQPLASECAERLYVIQAARLQSGSLRSLDH